MKQVIAIIAAAFALTAVAQPAKTPVAAEPTKAIAGDKVKAPVKSTVVKDEKTTAPTVTAAKPAASK
jgi:hypothetical protein